MGEGTYASWVQPVAEALAEDRRRLLEFVATVDDGAWDRPSLVEGWTNRDVLAHLAGGNDQVVQTLLRAVTAARVLEPGALAPDTDAENARRVAERRRWPVRRLIDELARDGDEVRSLLARLTEADRELRPEGLGLTLGQFLRLVQDEHHDLEHLAQFA